MNFDYDGSLGVKGSPKGNFAEVSHHDSGAEYVGLLDSQQFEGDGSFSKEEEHLPKPCNADIISKCGDLTSIEAKRGYSKPFLSVKVGKYGEISNISHQCKLLDDEKKHNNLDHFIAKPEFMECLAEGFVVKKLQKKQKSNVELEQFEEFQITVPPRSALLFPAQNAVTAEAVSFEVRNLIVLDGTWAKANRMYNENPWLKLIPSVRLDVEKMSMFSEVRHQPKPGYLSTIESIVYALQALGGNEKMIELNNLLDVLESMVEDQRRCKDERLKKQSSL
ncbi:DTW domain-containing protein YfiP [Bienertia sinuspersici]